MPQIHPPIEPMKKPKPVTQHAKVLAAIKNAPNGAPNHELSKLALKYTSVISDLRKDGHNILAVRQTLSNGKAASTWRYYLKEDA